MARISRKAKTLLQSNINHESFSIFIYQTGLYVRLSNEEEENGETYKIENQKEMLLNYIKDKPEYQLIEIYCDNGKTGRNFKRQEWIRLMEDVKKGKINCIIVKDLSRLGRNYIEAGNYIEKVFPFLGVRFIAITDEYDSEKDDMNLNRIMLPLKNIINDAYSKDLSKKIKSAREIQRMKGEFTGSIIPYGYKRDKDKKGHLLIDEKTAPVVKRIFQWISEGYSYSKVAKELNDLEIPSPKNRKWSYQFIRELTTKKVYIGHMVQGQKCKTENDIVIIPNVHEAIIEENLFNKVQKCKEDIHKNAPIINMNQVHSEEYLFSGILFAEYNKKPMYKVRYYKSGGTQIIKAYKSTKSFREDGTIYKLIQIREETLIKCVEGILYKYIEVLDVVSEYLTNEKVRDYYEKELKNINNEIEILKEQHRKAKEFFADVYMNMAEGIIQPKNYILYRKKYMHDEKQLEINIKEKMQEEKQLREMVFMENPYIKHLEKWGEDPYITKELIELLVDKIIVFSSKSIEIVFKFKDEFEQLYSLYQAGNKGDVSL